MMKHLNTAESNCPKPADKEKRSLGQALWEAVIRYGEQYSIKNYWF